MSIWEPSSTGALHRMNLMYKTEALNELNIGFLQSKDCLDYYPFRRLFYFGSITSVILQPYVKLLRTNLILRLPNRAVSLINLYSTHLMSHSSELSYNYRGEESFWNLNALSSQNEIHYWIVNSFYLTSYESSSLLSYLHGNLYNTCSYFGNDQVLVYLEKLLSTQNTKEIFLTLVFVWLSSVVFLTLTASKFICSLCSVW